MNYHFPYDSVQLHCPSHLRSCKVKLIFSVKANWLKSKEHILESFWIFDSAEISLNAILIKTSSKNSRHYTIFRHKCIFRGHASLCQVERLMRRITDYFVMNFWIAINWSYTTFVIWPRRLHWACAVEWKPKQNISNNKIARQNM